MQIETKMHTHTHAHTHTHTHTHSGDFVNLYYISVRKTANSP